MFMYMSRSRPLTLVIELLHSLNEAFGRCILLHWYQRLTLFLKSIKWETLTLPPKWHGPVPPMQTYLFRELPSSQYRDEPFWIACNSSVAVIWSNQSNWNAFYSIIDSIYKAIWWVLTFFNLPHVSHHRYYCSWIRTQSTTFQDHWTMDSMCKKSS